ncbi:MAG: phosphate signaling complex protein PhoU [Methanomicrobiales archaeon]|nr:phosphate signaling complex protein PhoU [Methanomicrobiales archaeon]
MVEKFHTEMEILKQDVLRMGSLARDMLKQSVEALIRQDSSLADWVIANKKTISDYDNDIEQKCLRLISLYQPMAKDMRIIATSLKLNTYFYRIGRYGKDIAVVEQELSTKPSLANLSSIPHMADLVLGMLEDALTAFEKEDVTVLQSISKRDNAVDTLRYSILRECITYMMEDPANIPQCTNYIMVARYLERCGDHACKIAEKVHYMVTGKRVEFK